MLFISCVPCEDGLQQRNYHTYKMKNSYLVKKLKYMQGLINCYKYEQSSFLAHALGIKMKERQLS
jgi:hypothetical protein